MPRRNLERQSGRSFECQGEKSFVEREEKHNYEVISFLHSFFIALSSFVVLLVELHKEDNDAETFSHCHFFGGLSAQCEEEEEDNAFKCIVVICCFVAMQLCKEDNNMGVFSRCHFFGVYYSLMQNTKRKTTTMMHLNASLSFVFLL